MKRILIDAQDGLIGDFLGSVPAMQRLAKDNNVYVKHHPEIGQLFEMTGLKNYDYDNYSEDRIHERRFDVQHTIGCTKAWEVAIPRRLHMTQGYYPLLDLTIPERAVKAELNLGDYGFYADPPDYILAPFSRSLPIGQKWRHSEWRRLCELMPDKTFMFIGHKRDEQQLEGLTNAYYARGFPFQDLCQLIKSAKQGLVSVLSGPSHLAFHLGVKNFLIHNQNMNWGINPDAVQIKDYIPDLRAETIRDILITNQK